MSLLIGNRTGNCRWYFGITMDKLMLGNGEHAYTDIRFLGLSQGCGYADTVRCNGIKKNIVEAAQKLKIELPNDLAIPLSAIAVVWLSICPKLLW